MRKQCNKIKKEINKAKKAGRNCLDFVAETLDTTTKEFLKEQKINFEQVIICTDKEKKLGYALSW